MSAMNEINAAILRAQMVNLPPDQIANSIRASRELLGESQFIRRLQVWPRGIVGDFETIEYIADAENREPASVLSYFSEQCALDCPIVQQHRNKLAWQANAILRCTRVYSTPNILSVGCGGCRDFVDVIPFCKNASVELIDIDADALVLAESRLSVNVRSLEIKCGNILREIYRLPSGRFELIIAGGIFDYVPDEHLKKLLLKLLQSLTRTGVLCMTNISNENPYRPWMEQLADWTLFHRNVQDITDNIPNAYAASSSRDATGITHLFEVFHVP